MRSVEPQEKLTAAEKESFRDRIPTLDEMGDRFEEAIEPAREKLQDFIEDVKPKLRGWLHLWTVPLVLIAGLTLTVLAPTALSRTGAAVYTFTSVLLFGVSAVYHRGNGFWDRRTHNLLRTFDHANIYFLIAGSITPFALLFMDGTARVTLLTVMWGGAITGAVLKVFWLQQPRWLSTTFYMMLGCIPIIFIGEFAQGSGDFGMAGTAALSLLATGGLLYTVGAVIYGAKALNTWPRVWGFHEWFHLCTVLAFICHFSAVALISSAA